MLRRKIIINLVVAFASICGNALGEDTSIEIPSGGKFAEINGFEMYYELHGSGPPLLCLPGYTGTSQGLWKSFAPDFSDHFQVILVDPRGRGRSTNPMGEFKNRQLAKDMIALLDYLRFGRDPCHRGK